MKIMFISKNTKQCKNYTKDMDSASFQGCIGSTDATHFSMMQCPVSCANEH
jgi:hypothetical protein